MYLLHMDILWFMWNQLYFFSRSRHLKTENTFPSTCSDDYLPKSTSEDSENVSLPKLAPIKNLPRSNHHLIPKYHERFQHLQRSGSLKSISSNISVESVHDYVKEKEDIWREKHNCPSRRKIRQQTLIWRNFLTKIGIWASATWNKFWFCEILHFSYSFLLRTEKVTLTFLTSIDTVT